MPNPHKVGYVKNYPRCEFTRAKGACENLAIKGILRARAADFVDYAYSGKLKNLSQSINWYRGGRESAFVWYK
jgi:hypothetical protein